MPANEKRLVSVYIDAEIEAALIAEAKRDKRSKSQMAAMLIESALSARREPKASASRSARKKGGKSLV